MRFSRSIAVLWLIAVQGIFLWYMCAQQIALTGRVLSAQGSPVRGAEVSIYDLQNQPLDDCTTNSKGEFVSSRIFKSGQQMRFEVSASGYENFVSKDITLKNGRYGTVTLNALSEIKGSIKSDQNGYLQGVTVAFFDQTGANQIGVATTDVNGAYKSGNLFKGGETILVKAKKPDYSEGSKTIRAAVSGTVTLDFILETRTNISGFVVDEVTLDPVAGAEVSFFDRDSRLITTRTTNQSGYYDFDNPFTLGEIVRVRIEKKDYRPGENTIIISKGINRLDFKLLKKIDEGIKVIVRVYNRKGTKPLEGAKISFQNRGSQEKTSSRDGETDFRINQRGGYDLPLRIRKPGYREWSIKHRLTEDVDNYVDINLFKEKTICPCFLYSAIGLAAVSGTSYYLVKKPYDAQKDIKNPERLNDYDEAVRYANIGNITAGVAGAAFTGWVVCKMIEKKRLKEAGNSRQRTGFSPLLPSGDPGFRLGIAYTF